MFNKIRNLLSKFINLIKYKYRYKHNATEVSKKYKSHNILKKTHKTKEIPKLFISNSNTKKVLLMDDNEVGVDLTNSDINELSKVADNLRESGIKNIPKKYKSFVESLDNNDLSTLHNFELKDFEIIISTTEQAAFSAIQLLETDNIDYAFLDIIIGGINYYNGKFVILDGIDVAFKILSKNPNAKILFYSGCNITESSTEYDKAKKLLDIDIREHIVLKDNNLMNKRLKLLRFLSK